MKSVLVCIPPNSAAYRDILVGFFRYARQALDWEIEMTSSFSEYIAKSTKASRNGRLFDGVVACCGIPPEMKSRVSQGAAIVAIALPTEFRRPSGCRVSHVDCDDEAVGAAGARHFLSLGTFNSYGFVGWKTDANGARERGFRDELTKRGLPCRTFGTTFPSRDDDKDSLSDWIRNLPKPAAVMAFYDHHARHVARVCRSVGVAVPRELSVIGVDNDELVCESAVPSLSSIAPDHESVGYAAAKELARLLRKKTAAGRALVVGKPLVIERESTRFVAPAVALVRAAVEFIRAHATEGISVDDVARGVGVSRRLLDLRFREVERRSVLEAIEMRKLSVARSLLCRSHYTLAEIARRSGYGHVKSFEAAFRRKMRVAPGSYRRENA